jgi:hypothetical protein
MLDNLKTDKSIQDDADVIGGNGPIDSALVDTVIDMAYLDLSKGGANSLNLIFKTKDGKTIKITEWITSGTAKGVKNYYETSGGDKRYLPGFNTANGIALLAVGKEISELSPEAKTVKIYDFDAKKEILVEKQVLTELHGQEITLGILKVIEDSNVKNGEGVYVPSGYTREANQIDKVFRTSDKLTVAEIKAEADEAVFYAKWGDKNTDVTRDKSAAKNGHIPKPKGGGNVASAGANAASGGSEQPVQSLFNK